MAQTTILAAGVTAATSTDVTIADAATATVVAFVNGVIWPKGLRLQVAIDTPNDNTVVGYLDGSDPDAAALQLVGPGVFRVIRPACSVAVGVSLEQG